MSIKPPSKKIIAVDGLFSSGRIIDVGHQNLDGALNVIPKKMTSLPINKKKNSAKDTESKELSDLNEGGEITAPVSSEITQDNVDFSQWYAQASSLTASDAISSSATASDTENAEALSMGAETAGNGMLSNGVLALLGVIAAGGAVAIAASANKSSSTSTPTTDSSAPVIQSVSANSATQTITLSYNEALDPHFLPLASAFSITTNGVVNTVLNVSVSSNVMTLTLANPFSSGALTITYTDPSSGNDLNAIQDLSGNDSSGFIKGIVADGYISGARIYLDLNGDGLTSENEYTGIVTSDDGSFFLPSALPNAPIIAKGGINMDTHLAQLTPLRAPAGSSAINPLTTLVQSVIDQYAAQHIGSAPLSAETAANQVATVLGFVFPDGFSLLNFDPLARNDALSLAVQKSAAQIATIINVSAQSNADVASIIMSNLANTVLSTTSSNSTIDLGALNASQLANLFTDTGITDSTSLIVTITNANTAINNAASKEDISAKQIMVAKDDFYVDNSAPLALDIKLFQDTGSSSADGITSNGLIKVKPHYLKLQTQLDHWFYSIDSGATWTLGAGDGFTLAVDTYNANSIQVRATDASNNSSPISTIARAIEITQLELSSATLSLHADTGIAGDKITSNGLIDVSLSPSTHSWAYSTDFGATWNTPSSPSAFTAPIGTYAKGSIELKQTDLAGHSVTDYFDSVLTVTSDEIARDPPVATTPISPADTTAPSVLNVIASVGSNVISIVFNETLHQTVLPRSSDFSLLSSTPSSIPSISNITIAGDTLKLTLDRNITSGDLTNALGISYADASPSNHTNAIEDVAGNAIAAFTYTSSSDAPLLARIKSFATTLIDSTADINFPVVGKLGVADLEQSLLDQIDTQFAEAIALRDSPPISGMQMLMSAPPQDTNNYVLGYNAIYAGDLFQINWASKTYSIKLNGLWNFGELPLADNLGFNWGEDNALLKMGVDINADVNTRWDIDLNLKGGWKNSPLESNFDVWLDQTVITAATGTTDRSLTGSYLATSINGSFASNASITGNLGPLTTTASNQNYYNPHIENSGASYQSPTSSALKGFAEVYVKDANGYNLDDLLNITSNYSTSFDVYYGVNSQLALDVKTGLDFNSALDKILPEFTFDVFVPLNFTFIDTARAITSEDQRTGKTAAYDNQNNNGWIYFDNMSLGVGDLINTLISPLTNFVDPMLQKFKPLVDFLQYDIVSELNASKPQEDWFSRLIQNVTGAIDWLPSVDLSQPKPPPTVNQFLVDSLLGNYDQVDLSSGEEGKVRIIDIFDGVTSQMRDALPKLELLKATTPLAASLYESISSALPYLQSSIAIMREVSEFMANYYDFVATEDQLVGSQYSLDFGTLALNVTTGEFDTSRFILPWNVASSTVTPSSLNADLPQDINVGSQAPLSVDDATAWLKILDLGSKIGLDVTVLSNSTDFVNAMMSKPADLVTFKPDFSSLNTALSNINSDIQLIDLIDAAASIPSLAFLIPVAKFVDFPLTVSPDISVIPRIEAGIDNYAILNKSDPSVTIWDSLYLADKHLNSSNQLVDLPELEASIDLTLKAFLGAGVRDVLYADVGAGLGISSDWAIDLVDPNNDGKVRGSEILNLPNFSGSADLIGQVYGSVDTFWTEKNYLYDAFNINLFSFDTAQQTVIPA